MWWMTAAPNCPLCCTTARDTSRALACARRWVSCPHSHQVFFSGQLQIALLSEWPSEPRPEVQRPGSSLANISRMCLVQTDASYLRITLELRERRREIGPKSCKARLLVVNIINNCTTGGMGLPEYVDKQTYRVGHDGALTSTHILLHHD